jgi:hypothetical protein
VYEFREGWYVTTKREKRDTYRNLAKKLGENIHLLGQEGKWRRTVRWIL